MVTIEVPTPPQVAGEAQIPNAPSESPIVSPPLPEPISKGLTEKPDSTRFEPPVDPEVIKQSVDLAWNEAINLILAKYDVREDVVSQQFEKQLGQKPDIQTVAGEVKKRQDALAANPELKSSLEDIIKADATKKAGDKALITNSLQPADKKEKEETIVARYYNAQEGIYYEIDQDEKPTQNEIRLEHTVKPILDELLKNANEKIQPDPTKLAEESPQAKRAQGLIGILLPRLVETAHGGYKFDKTPDLSIVKKSAEKKRAKEDREREKFAVDIALSAIDEITGVHVGQAIKDADKGLDGDIVKDLLKNITPDRALGALPTLLYTYFSLPADFPAEERGILAACIHQELNNLRSGLEMSNSHPDLVIKIRKFSHENETSFNEHFNELKFRVLRSAGYPADKITPQLLTSIGSSNLLDRILLAHACESQITEKPNEAPTLSDKAQTALRAYAKKGRLNDTEGDVLLSLAMNKAAGKLLQRIGFNLEELKNPSAVANITKKVVEEINERRAADNKLNEKAVSNYEEVLRYHMEGTLAKIDSKNPLGNWLKMLGMLALILGPGFSKFLDEGMVSGGGERQQE